MVWEQVQAEKGAIQSARNSHTLEKHKTGRGNKQFASEVASVVGGGRNPSSVKRDVQLKIARAENLGDDLQKIAGTSLDKACPWIEAEFGMSERTAQRYIQITNQYGANATRWRI